MPRTRKTAAPKSSATKKQSNARIDGGASGRSFFGKISDLVRDNPKTALSAGVAVLAGAVAAIAVPFGGSSERKSGKQKRSGQSVGTASASEAGAASKKMARKKRKTSTRRKGAATSSAGSAKGTARKRSTSAAAKVAAPARAGKKDSTDGKPATTTRKRGPRKSSGRRARTPAAATPPSEG